VSIEASDWSSHVDLRCPWATLGRVYSNNPHKELPFIAINNYHLRGFFFLVPPKNGGLGFWGLWHWVYHGLPPVFMGFYILGFGFSWGLIGIRVGELERHADG